MRMGLATFFLLVFTAASLQQLTVLALYAFNKEYITQMFCENKDKPVLKCNGKCHLSKVVAKSTEKEPTSESISNDFFVALYAKGFIHEYIHYTLLTDTFKCDREEWLKESYVFYSLKPPEYVV